jgi:16S rRNA (guanine966-N2)-methyltransferase
VSDAGRVIAGSARGIRLLPAGKGTRPLGDRVKQALFGMLDPYLPGARVLDLFAGSGAGGIEALSRGAARAVFVERDGGAAAAIAENLGRATLAERGTVARTDVARYLREEGPRDGPFNIVLIDPPYADTQLLDGALAALAATPDILAPDAWIAAKHFWRTPPSVDPGLLASVRTKRFGETALTLYRLPGHGTWAADEAEEGAAADDYATGDATDRGARSSSEEAER